MRSPAAHKTAVAVLGAGYAGLAAFLELRDRLNPRQYDLVLVNASPYHYFITELHTLAAGVQEEEVLRIPLRRLAFSPGRLVVAQVVRIDPSERTVILAGQEPFQYDYCIVGLGSDPEFFNVPGAAEHGLVIGNPEGARRLRERVAELVTCPPGERRSVVVVGGGLTGVEVAGELADAYPHCLRIWLVEAGPEIMPGFDPYLVREARRILEEKGIAIRTGSPIVRVEADRVHMRDGSELPYDLLIWAGGVRGSGVLAQSGFVTTARGRVPVDEYLRVPDHPEVYVVGDAASFTDPATGRELPPTAQAAVQMGRHAARNLLRRLAGKPEEPFRPVIRGAFASLGRGVGVGYIGGERYVGLPAAVLKRLIEAHHAYEAGGLAPVLARALRPAARWLGLRPRLWPARGAAAGQPEAAQAPVGAQAAPAQAEPAPVRGHPAPLQGDGPVAGAAAPPPAVH